MCATRNRSPPATGCTRTRRCGCPHISWSNPDLGGRIVELVVDNVRRYVAGEPLQGIVDPVERY